MQICATRGKQRCDLWNGKGCSRSRAYKICLNCAGNHSVFRCQSLRNCLPSFPWCTVISSNLTHKPKRGQKKRLCTSLVRYTHYKVGQRSLPTAKTLSFIYTVFNCRHLLVVESSGVGDCEVISVGSVVSSKKKTHINENTEGRTTQMSMRLMCNQRTLIPQALTTCMNIKPPMKMIIPSYAQLCNIITFLFLLKRWHITFWGGKGFVYGLN